MYGTETLNKYFRNTDRKLSLSMAFAHVSVCLLHTVESTILYILILNMSGFTCFEMYIKRQRNRKLNAISDVKKNVKERARI